MKIWLFMVKAISELGLWILLQILAGLTIGALLIGWYIDTPRIYHPLLAITLLVPSLIFLFIARIDCSRQPWTRRKKTHLFSLFAAIGLFIYYLLALYLKVKF